MGLCAWHFDLHRRGSLVLVSYGAAVLRGLRTQDKLEAEYALLSERNAAIQGDIDRLSTDEGIEDVAREQLGWVSKGETAGVVVGLSEDETSSTPDTVHSQIDSASVKTPDTWYSGVLDPLFGYSDAQ